jgi:adenosyl cobinamide kinase/adenosyl cobinamide phosphate guanylyltransferase
MVNGVAVPASTTFVLGGARSGKSAYAERIITALPSPWVYIATAQAADEEMRARIALHRARRDERWTTVEAPIDIAAAIGVAGTQPLLVDCLTLWVTNLLLGELDIDSHIESLEAALRARDATTVLVANEVGLGIVPDNTLARAFRDWAGRVNQHFAARADSVVFMVAGLPMRVK